MVGDITKRCLALRCFLIVLGLGSKARVFGWVCFGVLCFHPFLFLKPQWDRIRPATTRVIGLMGPMGGLGLNLGVFLRRVEPVALRVNLSAIPVALEFLA